MRLCAASRPVSSLPLSSRRSPAFQVATILGRERVEIHALRVHVGAPGDVGPVGELGHRELRDAASVEREVRVPRGRAVRDHRDRLGRGVRRVVEDLHVEHRGEPAESLRADAERVDLVVQLDAQFLDLVLRSARLELASCRCAPSATPSRGASPSPPTRRCRCRACRAGTSRRPWRDRLHDPVHDRVARVEHRELGLVLRAAALGGEPARRPCRPARSPCAPRPACCRACSSAPKAGSATIEARSTFSGSR